MTQSEPISWRELEAAVTTIQAMRGARLVVTGCELPDTTDGSLENVVFEGETHIRLTSPRLPIVPVGTGDLFTGLLTASLAHGHTLVSAARDAAVIVLDILGRTIFEGEHEMQLASVIDDLVERRAGDGQ